MNNKKRLVKLLVLTVLLSIMIITLFFMYTSTIDATIANFIGINKDIMDLPWVIILCIPVLPIIKIVISLDN